MQLNFAARVQHPLRFGVGRDLLSSTCPGHRQLVPATFPLTAVWLYLKMVQLSFPYGQVASQMMAKEANNSQRIMHRFGFISI